MVIKNVAPDRIAAIQQAVQSDELVQVIKRGRRKQLDEREGERVHFRPLYRVRLRGSQCIASVLPRATNCYSDNVDIGTDSKVDVLAV